MSIPKPKKENIKATTCSTLKQSKDSSEKLCQVEQQLTGLFHYKFYSNNL